MSVISIQQPEKSTLCEYSLTNNHRIAWQEAPIPKMKSDFSKLLFAVSWFINKESNILNKIDGLNFPSYLKELQVKLLVVLSLVTL